MSNINITRHDRGLDSKRIEKIIGMITSKISDIKYDRRDVLRDRKKELREEYIKEHNLQPHFDEIKKVNDKVKELEEQIEEIRKQVDPHKAAIAELFRGDRESTYLYNEVRDKSPADEYIESKLPNISEMKEQLDKLDNEMEEQLWLAKDIDEARALYNTAIDRIEEITKGI